MKRTIAVLAFSSMLLTIPVEAGTIVSVLGNPEGPGSLDSSSTGQIAEVSWSQATAMSNVSIQAALFGAFGPNDVEHVQAYLTNAIGPGTTAANVFAFNSVVVNNEPWGQFPPVWTTLFSGLNLSAGTYYLVLGSTDFTAWYFAVDTSSTGGQPITITTAPGVTYNGTLAVWNTACCGTIDSAFLPASSGWRSDGDQNVFQVTGDTVPEPGTFALLLTGLLAILPVTRRHFRKH